MAFLDFSQSKSGVDKMIQYAPESTKLVIIFFNEHLHG